MLMAFKAEAVSCDVAVALLVGVFDGTVSIGVGLRDRAGPLPPLRAHSRCWRGTLGGRRGLFRCSILVVLSTLGFGALVAGLVEPARDRLCGGLPSLLSSELSGCI